jgi:hypothetical protein
LSIGPQNGHIDCDAKGKKKDGENCVDAHVSVQCCALKNRVLFLCKKFNFYKQYFGFFPLTSVDAVDRDRGKPPRLTGFGLLHQAYATVRPRLCCWLGPFVALPIFGCCCPFPFLAAAALFLLRSLAALSTRWLAADAIAYAWWLSFLLCDAQQEW